MSWDAIPLSDAYWFQEGPGVRKWQFTTEGIKLLNVGNITPDGQIDLDATDRHLSEEEATGKYAHFLVDSGDLVIASSGISFDDDGFLRTKIAFVQDQHLPLCMNTSTIRFKATEKLSDLHFLRHWLQSFEFRSQVSKFVTGSAQLNFGPSHLKKMTIKLPPLPEQKRIAAILDQADALRRQRQRALDHLNQLGQSIFYEMFGDSVSNPLGLEKVKLSSVCQVGSGKRVFASEFLEDGVPFYRGTEIGKLGAGDEISPKLFIAPNHYDELIDHTGKPELGDLLLPSICHDGRIWKVDSEKPFYFKDGRVLWIKNRESKIDSEYLRQHLKNLFLHNYASIASGSTFAELKIVNLKNLMILNPPIVKQVEFSNRIKKVKSKRDNLDRSNFALQTLFASLQQRAFRGEL